MSVIKHSAEDTCVFGFILAKRFGMDSNEIETVSWPPTKKKKKKRKKKRK